MLTLTTIFRTILRIVRGYGVSVYIVYDYRMFFVRTLEGLIKTNRTKAAWRLHRYCAISVSHRAVSVSVLRKSEPLWLPCRVCKIYFCNISTENCSIIARPPYDARAGIVQCKNDMSTAFFNTQSERLRSP